VGYRPPEEFEQQSESAGQGESRSATLQVFENDENNKNEVGVSELMARQTACTVAADCQSRCFLGF